MIEGSYISEVNKDASALTDNRLADAMEKTKIYRGILETMLIFASSASPEIASPV
jgi:hypothetical protein